jgi:hypothetical protein
MQMNDLWEAVQWIWKWYPELWKLVVPDDPFHNRSVKYWRNTWLAITIAAAVFGWEFGPLLLDGPASQRELAAFGFFGLAVLGMLTRLRPLDVQTPFWRPFTCVSIFLLLPYLVPWTAYRLNAFINDHWNESINKWMPDAPDPAMSAIDGLINLTPYFTFSILAALLIVVARHFVSPSKDRIRIS